MIEQGETGSNNTKVLLLGVGNPIMGDDGVGIHVARIVRERVPSLASVEVRELSLGGLQLVEAMMGHKHVIIVDAYTSEAFSPGTIREFTPEQLGGQPHMTLPHALEFLAALDLYKDLEPERIPETVRIFTVDVDPVKTFRESLSPTVHEAALKLADQLVLEIERALGQTAVPSENRTFFIARDV